MEKEILLKAKDGDPEAFKKLYEQYGEYALRVALAVMRNKSDASDAVQETFINVYHSLKNFDADRPFKPWFYKILINECYKIFNKKSKTLHIRHHLESTFHTDDCSNYTFEEYEDLYAAIESLNEINRIPIILKYLNGFSEQEISEILGLNINTVKSRLFKGRNKLRAILEKLEERRIQNG